MNWRLVNLNKDLKNFLEKAKKAGWRNMNELSEFKLSNDSVITLITDREIYSAFSKTRT